VLLDNILCYGHSKTRACMRRSCICAPVIAIKHFLQLLFFYPFAVVLKEKLMLNLDAILIRRAVTNLILNALVHNDPDVKIVVQLEQKERTHVT
jgi:signal transduction histidine kinase